METKSPFLFEIYQTREAVPANLRVNLITPYDPSLPVKNWVDTNQIISDDELISYTIFKYMANGNVAWNDAAKRPLFKTQFIPRDLVDKLNIPPKDFTGQIQEATQIGVWHCPVLTIPPDGFEWGLSLGITPIFVKTASKPVTLEDIYAEIKRLHEKFDALKRT